MGREGKEKISDEGRKENEMRAKGETKATRRRGKWKEQGKKMENRKGRKGEESRGDKGEERRKEESNGKRRGGWERGKEGKERN